MLLLFSKRWTAFFFVITLIFLSLILALTALTSPAHGSEITLKARANQSVISNQDVDNLIHLLEYRSGKKMPPAVLPLIRRLALEKLISTHILIDQAQRDGFEVTNDDVDNLITRQAKAEGKTRDQFLVSMKKKGLSILTYELIQRGEIARAKLMRRHILPHTTLDDARAPIETIQERLKKNKGKTEYFLSKFHIDQSMLTGFSKQTRKKALDALAAYMKSPQALQVMHSMLSQNYTQFSSGRAGWFTADEIDNDYGKKPSRNVLGHIIIDNDPINQQYVIITTLATRARGKKLKSDMIIDVMIAAFEPDAGLLDSEEIHEHIKKNIRSCSAFTDYLKKTPLLGNARRVQVAYGKISKQLQTFFDGIAVGSVSNIVPSPDGLMLYYVCGKKIPTFKDPTLQEIQEEALNILTATKTYAYQKKVMTEHFIDYIDK